MTRGNKFNAVKVKLDGYTFDSKAEAKRWCELKLLEKAGKVSWIKVHPRYELYVNGQRIASYKADFLYTDERGRDRIEDVKSPATAKKRDFVLIRKLMRACHGIDVEVLL